MSDRLPTTACRRVAWIASALFMLGCAEEAAEPGFEARASDPDPTEANPRNTEDVDDDRWYSIILPPNAAVGTNDQEDVIDAVYVVPPVTLTVLHPIPRQRELDTWASTVRELFRDEPVIGEEDGTVGSVSAIVQLTRDSLRWVFVADEFGCIVKCFAAEPRERAWLHEHCDPLMGEMSLLRPIHD